MDKLNPLFKDAGWLHLDRDDQGIVNFSIIIDVTKEYL